MEVIIYFELLALIVSSDYERVHVYNENSSSSITV